MIIPPQITAIAAAAVGAATVILSAASMTNMYETYVLVQNHPQRLSPPPASSLAKTPLAVPTFSTPEEALEGLSRMKKKELGQLFLHCDPPSISNLDFTDNDGDDQGDWRYDGYLLDNGPILTPVTNFITNRLFGRGQQWLGKAYLTPASSFFNGKTSSSNDATVMGIGKNRFSRSRRKQQVGASSNSDEFLDRTFEYSIGRSVLPSMSSSKSLFNRYASHCSAFSPMSLIWRGMVDELRLVALENNGSRKTKKVDERVVLLGMGYFSWSGGVWNMAPFCLVARKCGSC